MARQLVLMDSAERDWRLDEYTKELGRRGISQARSVLQKAVVRVEDRRWPSDN